MSRTTRNVQPVREHAERLRDAAVGICRIDASHAFQYSPFQIGTHSTTGVEIVSVFWRWWAAGTTSGLGSAIGGVALPLTALAVLDATPFEMGLIAAARYAAWIVIGLPAGVIVQRLPLRGAQVGADAGPGGRRRVDSVRLVVPAA